MKEIIWTEVEQPPRDCSGVPVELTEATIKERREKVLARMKEQDLDQLIIYGDVEHGSNFAYLVGYFTRFEEALLVISRDGAMKLFLGNENLNKAPKARVSASATHVPMFSLPNQPNQVDKTLTGLLEEAGIRRNMKVGLTGWKKFTSKVEQNEELFDVPAFIVDAIKKILGEERKIFNATDVFIGEHGARTVNNANEIAHYEYGASLASDCILDAMNLLVPGVSELELGDALVRYGQHTSVVTIAASGERFLKANMFPRENKIRVGDPISLTVGYAGGSSSRAGYAVAVTEELPVGAEVYLEQLAVPYFRAYTTWLEQIHIGMEGGTLFQVIESVLPRKDFHWTLCPGHLVAEEEWMSSPIYENSGEILRSGMIFQIDIIPSVTGMGGVCAESTVVLADDGLKADIQSAYPEMWERMQNRIQYLKEKLNIQISDDVLPMCGTVAYLRPYLLDKSRALAVKR